MVFSSVAFLFYFLPLFLVVYFITPTTRGKNIVTLIFSLVFYAWGEPWFVLVLLGATAFNTAAAVFIDQREKQARTWAMAVAITLNLLLLVVFKYLGFFAASLDNLLRPIGVTVPVPDIQLPLGISFFTFHGLSYLIDVYRRRFPANRDPVEVALYVTLFPQLVAGPIVRYKTVARQLRKRISTLGRASAGARIFVIGLAQKVLIADQVSQLVEVIFDHTQHPVLGEAWLGVVAYTIQIYFDFSGYSNMAVGIGLILGFTLPRNFRLPYLSQSITEFWRRWHISLSSWLRDYLYIPLGGNRHGPARTYLNLITVFLLCGLWHGANWNFVLWGIWHGGFLVVERLGLGYLLLKLPPVLRWGYALLAVMGGWVLFRAHDLDSAGRMYGGLVGKFGVGSLTFETHSALQPAVAFWLILGCLCAVSSPRLMRLPAVPAPLKVVGDGIWTFGLLFFSALWIAAGTYSPFLYFRF